MSDADSKAMQKGKEDAMKHKAEQKSKMEQGARRARPRQKPMLSRPLAVNPVRNGTGPDSDQASQMEPEAQVVNPVVLCPEEPKVNLREPEDGGADGDGNSDGGESGEAGDSGTGR